MLGYITYIDELHNQKYLNVLVRREKYGVNMAKSNSQMNKNKHHFSEESDFLSENPLKLQELLLGKTIKL